MSQLPKLDHSSISDPGPQRLEGRISPFHLRPKLDDLGMMILCRVRSGFVGRAAGRYECAESACGK